jgi:hypothetical protein
VSTQSSGLRPVPPADDEDVLLEQLWYGYTPTWATLRAAPARIAWQTPQGRQPLESQAGRSVLNSCRGEVCPDWIW